VVANSLVVLVAARVGTSPARAAPGWARRQGETWWTIGSRSWEPGRSGTARRVVWLRGCLVPGDNVQSHGAPNLPFVSRTFPPLQSFGFSRQDKIDTLTWDCAQAGACPFRCCLLLQGSKSPFVIPDRRQGWKVRDHPL